MTSVIRWVARVVAVLFIIFLILFSLDVFGQSYKSWEILLAFFIHMLPAILVIVALLLAWQKGSWAGGVTFLVLALASLLFFGFSTLPFIAVPLLFVGALFLFDEIIK